MTEIRPRLGLALGSGAARGMAHIGVLRALADAGMPPDMVAGTSIGALVGGVYAAGRLNEFVDIVLGLDWRRSALLFLEASFPRSGLIEGIKVAELLRRILGWRSVPERPVAFRAVATDVWTGREVVIDDGDLVSAIRASIAVPGIFTPAKRRGDLLIDGGLVNPVPVSVCRAMRAERVIAVDLNYGRITARRRPAPSGRVKESGSPSGAGAKRVFEWMEKNKKRIHAGVPGPVKEWMDHRQEPNIFDVLGTSLCIMEGQITETRLKIDPPDLLIRPRVGHVQFLDFFLAKEMIEEGYRAAKEALKPFE